MPTEVIPIGTPFTMTQNVIYALPAVETQIMTDTTGATLQVSNTVAFTNNVALTLTAGQTAAGGAFIRSTAGNALVVLKRD